MRKILFKGKSKYNNEWIYGFLVRLGKESFSDPDRYGITDKGIPIGNMNVCYNFQVDEVVPETVGQYTGLTDKNGLKIFEFDICQYGDYIVVVDFDEQDSRFAFVVDKNVKADFNYIREKDLKVIGNIFDNPELLKGVTEQ